MASPYEVERRLVADCTHSSPSPIPDRRPTRHTHTDYLMPQTDRDYVRGLLEKRGSPVTLYEARVNREYRCTGLDRTSALQAPLNGRTDLAGPLPMRRDMPWRARVTRPSTLRAL